MKPDLWKPFHIRHLNQFWWEEASLFTAVQWKQNSIHQVYYSLDVPVNHISIASACCRAHHVTILSLGFQTQNCWKWRDFPKITLNYISLLHSPEMNWTQQRDADRNSILCASSKKESNWKRGCCGLLFVFVVFLKFYSGLKYIYHVLCSSLPEKKGWWNAIKGTTGPRQWFTHTEAV